MEEERATEGRICSDTSQNNFNLLLQAFKDILPSPLASMDSMSGMHHQQLAQIRSLICKQGLNSANLREFAGVGVRIKQSALQGLHIQAVG